MAAGLLILGVVLAAPKYKLFAWNSTSSMPAGLYVRAILDEPAVGKIVAFNPPAVAVDYTKQRGEDISGMYLLKPLVAGPGDHVCVTTELRINGKHIAPVYATNPDGVPVPRWDGCRELELGEWFTYAPRIWNSFDGRSYGPVHDADMIGVFLPVWPSDHEAEQFGHAR
jgi:type IV secretory pathway protease TraF